MEQAIFTQQVALPVISEYFDYSYLDMERMSYAIQVLRIDMLQFCQAIVFANRVEPVLRGKISDIFVGCFLLVNKLSDDAIPNRCISMALTVPCVDLIQMELQCLDAISSLRICACEVQSLFDLVNTEQLI